MIIGDTMGRLNIIDFGLSNMSSDYKRNFFYQLDAQLKVIHQNGGIVRNFHPRTVYIDEDSRVPSFQAVYPNSMTFFDEEDLKRAQIEDVEMLSTLAFCVYLSDGDSGYRLEDGLIQFDVLKKNMDFVNTYFPEEDLEYYEQVFTDSDNLSYYSEYINRKMNQSNSLGVSRTLTKSTEAGRAMAQNQKEAAYVNYILTFSMVAVLTMLFVLAAFLIR